MWTDPVVDEIHKIREKMLAEVGGDTAKLMAKIRENQATGGRVIVGEVHRRVVVATVGESPSHV
jgi:hypothetical protein